MYVLFFILPLVIMIPLMIYFYFFFKRILLVFYHDSIKKWMYIILALISFIFVVPAFNLFGFWAVVVLHIFAFGLFIDIFYWILKRKNKHYRFKKIYQLGIIPVLCLLMVLGYGYYNMKNVQERQYTIYTQKDIHQDYCIALITDLHFGNTMNQDELQSYCQKISQQSPDIVLLGGDIVDERSSKEQMQQAFETLSTIQNQYGIYYVYGNHDRATYSSKPSFTYDELIQTIENNQIRILKDEWVSIQDDMYIMGREDRSIADRSESREFLKTVNTEKFLLMLDHQPVDLTVNDQLGYDLQLSGHTHGGQMFPVGLISDFLGFGEMNYGYRQMEHMQVIVSSGIAGWGYPLRTGSHSEYVIIHLIKS